MSKLLLWMLLTSLTGSPLLSAVVILVGYWVLDHYTLGLLPNPFRFVRRWERELRLRRLLSQNPHDRRARVELADLLLIRRRPAEALLWLRPNLEAGDEDADTLFLMGLACLGSGHAAQGETLMEEVEKVSPNFRMGAVSLELGRWRLKRGDAVGACAALTEFCRRRPGTVEGKVLLSKVQLMLKDDVAAAYTRADAWKDYSAAPRFQQRRDRLWAWRAKPSRPILYAVALGVGATLVGHWVVPALTARSHFSQRMRDDVAQDDSP